MSGVLRACVANLRVCCCGALHALIWSDSLTAQVQVTREAAQVTPAGGGTTSVAVDPATAAKLAVPLETLLRRRVVVDRGAAATILTLATAYPLDPDEGRQWALMQLQAAGLMVVETPIAAVIGKPEDEVRLRAIAGGRMGESSKLRTVIQLRYVEAGEVAGLLGGVQVAGVPDRAGRTAPEFSPSGENAQAMRAGAAAGWSSGQRAAGGREAPRLVLTSFQRDGVEVTCDPKNRQVILYGEESAVMKLQGWIREVDKRPEGVVIEAVIGEITKGRTIDFGVDWQRLLKEAGSKWSWAFEQAGTLGNNPAITPTLTAFEAFPRQLGFTAYGSYMGELAVAVNALESTVGFKVIQRPTISTLNNTKATIFVGQQIPVQKQTLTQGGFTSQNATLAATTEFVPVRLQLEVTPHIYSGGEVRLEITEQHNDVAGFVVIGGNQVPRISEQGLDNVVVCPDGGTVLMGGLVADQVGDDAQGLPFLSRVPVLGRVFGRSRDSKERRQLVVMLHVRVDGSASAAVSTAVDYSARMRLPSELSSVPRAEAVRDLTPLFR